MKIKIAISILFCTIILSSYGQATMGKIDSIAPTNKDSIISFEVGCLTINNDILMPEDSLETKSLLASISGFLSAAQENSENSWVKPSEYVETKFLIDEIYEIQKNEAFENDSFYKPYVTNIIPIEENEYVVMISYIGVHNDSPILRASFELLACLQGEKYLISSPLKRYTQDWKTKTIHNHHFHYPNSLDDKKAQNFADRVIFYDEQLDNNTGMYHYYLIQDGLNTSKLIGVEYKVDYNGWKNSLRWESDHENTSVWVANEGRVFGYDTHDLWHNRLRRVIPRNEIHRRVDCHIATLYGGIWGFSWDELFPIFYEKFTIDSNVDWLDHKAKKSHFLTNGIRGERKNYTDDFVGALLINKIEKEIGFDKVWELLKTKRTKDDKEYYEVLEKLVGISKKNYNREIMKLIREEAKKHNF